MVEGLVSLKMRLSTKRTLKTFLQEHTELIGEIRRLFRVGIEAVLNCGL